MSHSLDDVDRSVNVEEITSHFPLTAWQPSDFANLAVLSHLSQSIPEPEYKIGSHCRWIPQPSTDSGKVIGQVYLPVAEVDRTNWSWMYLLLLDESSLSRQWIVADWVGEENLESLPFNTPTKTEL